MNDHADRIESIAMDLHRGHCAGLPSERWRTWGGEDDTQREHFRRAARAAIAALEAGRSGEAGCYVHESALRLLAEGQEAVATSIYRETLGGRVYLAPQQPPPVGVTDALISLRREAQASLDRVLTEQPNNIEGNNALRARINAIQDCIDLSLSQQEAAPSVSEERYVPSSGAER